MTIHRFSLSPHVTSPISSDLTITGSLSRYANKITLCYQLAGELAAIAIPTVSDTPSRQDQLWEKTCFECFLGLPDASSYWELNLSPSNNWNVYRFEGYRLGMQPEAAITELPFETQSTMHTYQLVLTLSLDPLVPPSQPLLVGLAVVLQTHDQQLSYWALAHSLGAPDFHQRHCFQLKL